MKAQAQPKTKTEKVKFLRKEVKPVIQEMVGFDIFMTQSPKTYSELETYIRECGIKIGKDRAKKLFTKFKEMKKTGPCGIAA